MRSSEDFQALEEVGGDRYHKHLRNPVAARSLCRRVDFVHLYTDSMRGPWTRVKYPTSGTHSGVARTTNNQTETLPANVLVEQLRFRVRLAFDLRCLRATSYGFAAGELGVIGRMVGGWRKVAGRFD